MCVPFSQYNPDVVYLFVDDSLKMRMEMFSYAVIACVLTVTFVQSCLQTVYQQPHDDCKVALAGSDFPQCSRTNLEDHRPVCELREVSDLQALRKVAVIVGLNQVSRDACIPSHGLLLEYSTNV